MKKEGLHEQVKASDPWDVYFQPSGKPRNPRGKVTCSGQRPIDIGQAKPSLS